MSGEISRRRFLRGTLAGTVAVAGFDTVLRSWVSAAELEHHATALAEDFPVFDGVLLLDDVSRAAAADDFGHLVHRQPLAVLRPGSVNDVVKLIKFARRNDIQVAARGQGHSTQGQAQVEAGVVVDMVTLATVHEINPTNALVDGGTRWLDLLTQTIPQGLTPPTLVDFLELSVGGVLSLGGVGSQAFRFGPHVDNILELQVVTGKGSVGSHDATTLSRHHVTRRYRVTVLTAPKNGPAIFAAKLTSRVRTACRACVMLRRAFH